MNPQDQGVPRKIGILVEVPRQKRKKKKQEEKEKEKVVNERRRCGLPATSLSVSEISLIFIKSTAVSPASRNVCGGRWGVDTLG